MHTSKATIHAYDYQKKHKKRTFGAKEKKDYTKLKIFITLIILLPIIFCIYKYNDSDKIKEIEKRIAISTDRAKAIIADGSFKNDYLLITFPDTSGKMSKNGYLINEVGGKFKEFTSGYILMYRDGSYEYQLESEGYCLKKDLNDDQYKLSIFTKCSSNDVDYLIKQ